MPDRRSWLPWLAAAWIVAAGLWFFTRDLPGGAGTRAAVAGDLALQTLVPERLWEETEGLPTGWAGALHPWRWRAWGTAIAVWLAAWLLGDILLARLRLCFTILAERAALRFGLGTAGLSLLTLLCGSFGLGSWISSVVWAFAVSAPLTVLIGSEVPGQFWGTLHPTYWLRLPRNRKRWLVFALAVAPFLLLIALGSTVPTTEFDAREYHLQGPKEWFLAGRIERLPHNVYTQMPAGSEMLTLLCMHLCGDWRGGALAGQATLAGFVPLAALAAGCVARRLFGAGCGWFAAAAFLTSPWAVRLALHPYAEGALCAYGTLTLLAVTIAIRRRRLRSVRPAILAGLLAGAAFGCKYPALLLIAAPAGVALLVATWGAGRARRLAATAKLGAFVGGFAVFAGPWLLKNTIETGNPVFPLLWNLLGGTGWDAATNARWVAAHGPPDWSPVRWPHWVGQPLGLDLFHTVLVIAFAPLAVLVRPTHAKRLAAALGGLILVWYMATHRIDRFWVPLLPAGCVLAGAGLAWATRRAERPVRVAAWAVAGAGVLFNFAIIAAGVASAVPFTADPRAAGPWVEERSAPLIAALNERFGPGDAVVLIGEAQAFGAEFDPIYATVWNEPPLADPDAPLPPQVAAVAVNWAEIARYRDSYGFDPRATPRFLDERVKRGELASGEPIVVNDRIVGELFLVPR